MKKKELRRQIRELQAELDSTRKSKWMELPFGDRQAIVSRWVYNRAVRRAAQAPFARSFEDEINNAAVDVYRDINRASF